MSKWERAFFGLLWIVVMSGAGYFAMKNMVHRITSPEYLKSISTPKQKHDGK